MILLNLPKKGVLCSNKGQNKEKKGAISQNKTKILIRGLPFKKRGNVAATPVFETCLKLDILQCKSNFNRNQVLLLTIGNFENNQIVLYLRGGYMMHL